jgi:hypothetical protein
MVNKMYKIFADFYFMSLKKYCFQMQENCWKSYILYTQKRFSISEWRSSIVTVSKEVIWDDLSSMRLHVATNLSA